MKLDHKFLNIVNFYNFLRNNASLYKEKTFNHIVTTCRNNDLIIEHAGRFKRLRIDKINFREYFAKLYGTFKVVIINPFPPYPSSFGL